LKIAISIRLGRPEQVVALEDALAAYRTFLYESGQPREAEPGEKPRRGFTHEEIAEVLANGGKLPLGDIAL
jgi:hypothetical protein